MYEMEMFYLFWWYVVYYIINVFAPSLILAGK